MKNKIMFEFPPLSPPDLDATVPKNEFSSIKVPDSFPLKYNKKKYSLHHVAFPGTWQIDLMLGTGNVYLVAIEVNTRYLYMQRTNTYVYDKKGNLVIDTNTGTYKIETKSAFAVAGAIAKLFRKGWYPSLLIGDSEGAFSSNELNEKIFKPFKINFRKVFLFADEIGKRHSNHTSLAIVDRVIRTCRKWFATNGFQNNVFPVKDMDQFVEEYNNRPHSTLCKIFKNNDITPTMVHEDMKMELYVMNHILKENKKIRETYKDWHIPDGTLVKLYNPPIPLLKRTRITKVDPYRVVRSNGNIYTVKNANEHLNSPPEEQYPRIWLDYL